MTLKTHNSFEICLFFKDISVSVALLFGFTDGAGMTCEYMAHVPVNSCLFGIYEI